MPVIDHVSGKMRDELSYQALGMMVCIDWNGTRAIDEGRGVSDFVRFLIEVPMHLRVSLF